MTKTRRTVELAGEAQQKIKRLNYKLAEGFVSQKEALYEATLIGMNLMAETYKEIWHGE